MSRALAVLQWRSNNQQLVGGNKQRQRIGSIKNKQQQSTAFQPIDENADSLSNLRKKSSKELDAPGKLTVKQRSVSVGCDFRAGSPVPVACQTEVTTTQTSTDSAVEDVKRQLLSANPTTSYWKSLAEEREKALSETLKENLSLCQQLAAANERIQQLEYLAAEGQRYAAILKLAIEQPDSDDEDAAGEDDQAEAEPDPANSTTQD